ncbi:MAG: MFS transporter [Sphingomonadales bacterium]|nr:MAG: MFS transporter [Sphingomonadales bacterium]
MTAGGKAQLSNRTWVLIVLSIVYFVNFLDRSIIYVVQEQIKADFQLTDQQVGLLGGTAFGLLYGAMGIPLARLAERWNRRNIVIFAVTAWSVVTGLCGFCQNYLQLLLARAGVAIGEAGGTPPSHSIISDYFPANRRATALALYTLAVPTGIMMGTMIGGWLASRFGWQKTFMILAVPGILAALLLTTIKEPPRGHSDALIEDGAAPSFGEVVRHALRERAYVNVVIGSGIAAFAAYGVQSFTTAFLLRNFSMDLASAGLAFGLIFGLGSGIGTVVGGIWVDRAAERDVRMRGWLPAIFLAATGPMFMLGYAQSNSMVAIAILFLAGVLSFMHQGASYGVIQNSFPPRMRATGVAAAFMAQALIGLGLGPLVMGMLSDHFAAAAYAGQSFSADCVGAGGVATACKVASAQGLRLALIIVAGAFVIAALYYWRVAAHIGRNTGGKPAAEEGIA